MVKITPTTVEFNGHIDLYSGIDDLSCGLILSIQTVIVHINLPGFTLGGIGIGPHPHCYPRDWFDFINRKNLPFDPVLFPRHSYTVFWSEKGFEANRKTIMQKFQKKFKHMVNTYNIPGLTVAQVEAHFLEMVKDHFDLIRSGQNIRKNKAVKKYNYSCLGL